HRARAGDHGQRVRAYRHAADLDHRPVRVVLPADELVRHGNPHHVQDAVAAAQVQRAELIHVPDQADDRAGHAAAHERLAAGRPRSTITSTPSWVASGAITTTIGLLLLLGRC